MTTLLLILRTIATYRSLLFPALMGFVGAVVHAMGWAIDIGKVQTVLDATFGLLTAVSVVVGAVLDVNNARTTKVVNGIAAQLDTVTPEGVVAPKLPDPPTSPATKPATPPLEKP